jgi:hypothetical protein
VGRGKEEGLVPLDRGISPLNVRRKSFCPKRFGALRLKGRLVRSIEAKLLETHRPKFQVRGRRVSCALRGVPGRCCHRGRTWRSGATTCDSIVVNLSLVSREEGVGHRLCYAGGGTGVP